MQYSFPIGYIQLQWTDRVSVGKMYWGVLEISSPTILFTDAEPLIRLTSKIHIKQVT